MNLVGRDHEQALLSAFVVRERTRLVTLTGPGGIGKTRLAQWAAAALADSFAAGTHVIDLAPVAAPDQVPTTLAAALHVADASAQSPLEAVAAALGGREVLLVLDNFEHLLPAAVYVQRLLECCPRLSVLVTSRAALHVAQERVIVVPALDEAAAV